MNDGLTDRLNHVLPKITSDTFLRGTGIGNEIAFYIFDYPPEDELRIREHIQFLLEHIPKHKPGMRVTHVNLLDFVLDHLRGRKLLDKAIAMQKTKGDQFVQKQLATLLHPNKIAPAFAEIAQPDQHGHAPQGRAHRSGFGAVVVVCFVRGASRARRRRGLDRVYRCRAAPRQRHAHAQPYPCAALAPTFPRPAGRGRTLDVVILDW